MILGCQRAMLDQHVCSRSLRVYWSLGGGSVSSVLVSIRLSGVSFGDGLMSCVFSVSHLAVLQGRKERLVLASLFRWSDIASLKNNAVRALVCSRCSIQVGGGDIQLCFSKLLF